MTNLTPNFEFDKHITVEDIKTEAALLIKQGNEAAEAMENRFPVEVFAPLFHDLINECSKSLNFPTDYTGTAILSAISTAIGKSAKVKVTAAWYEFAALYIGIVGNAGANKSHPLDMALKPFESIDKAMIDRFKDEYKEFSDYQSLSKKDKKEDRKSVV